MDLNRRNPALLPAAPVPRGDATIIPRPVGGFEASMTRLMARRLPPVPGGEDEQLDRIAAAVRRARGIDLAHYRRSYLLRRLAVRQRALGGADLPTYAGTILREPAEVDHLLRALTINVSEFFRNPSMFRLLETEILPPLLQTARDGHRRLQVWSAGCAGGDEIYSLAILLARLRVPRGGAALTGTDIDPEAIAAARSGEYEANRLRELTAEVRDAYFSAVENGRAWRVCAERLPPVRFRVHDLLADPPRRSLDLVLCRNVLIYFRAELQETIIARLARALRPGGVLVLGRVERLADSTRDQFEIIDLRERIYRKISVGASHAS